MRAMSRTLSPSVSVCILRAHTHTHTFSLFSCVCSEQGVCWAQGAGGRCISKATCAVVASACEEEGEEEEEMECERERESLIKW